MKAVTVNVVSESAFTVGGHGVHTAFLEDLELLRKVPELRVVTNGWRPAEVLHVHTLGPFAAGQLLRARGRSVVTAHLSRGSLSGSLAGDRYWGGAFTQYAVRLYNLAGRVLALSEYAAAELAALGVRRPIVTVPNAIDVDRLVSDGVPREVARERLGVPADAFVVVGVGQVQPRKGVQSFLRCAELVGDARFYWVGDMIFGAASASRRKMSRLMASAPGNVRFTGQVPREDVLAYLAAADVFLLPSYHENCPMAVLEAMALGVPVILRALDRYQDLFQDDCLYGVDETFPDLVGGLRSDDVRHELGRRSAVAARRFDAAARSQRLQRIYAELSG